MKILVVTTTAPADTNMPGCPRLMNVSRELAKRHSLSLLLIESPYLMSEVPEDRNYLSQVFTNIQPILGPDEPAPLLGEIRHRTVLAAKYCLRFRFPSYLARIREEIQRQVPLHDAVFVRGLAASQFVQKRPSERCILDMVDCESLIFWNTATRDGHTPLTRINAFVEAIGLARMERRYLAPYDVVTVITEQDDIALQTVNPSVLTSVIPNGVDTSYFAPTETPLRLPNRIMFSGLMTDHRNEDAAVYFATEVLPIIQAKRPSLEFFIVGAAPSDRVKELSLIRGVTVTGGVPDIRPFLSSSSLYVCPLRYGAGMKNKILTAMAAGTPIVATSTSINGIDVQPGEHLLLADAPEAFADAVLVMLADPERARNMASSARSLVEHGYSWKSAAAQFETLLFPDL